MSIKLYGNTESQYAYKIRLALGLLKVDYERVTVDLRAGEQRKEWFLKLNPNGKIPVYVEDDFALWESNAILLYLAHRFAPNGFLPENLRERAEMHQWLHYEATTISRFTGIARFMTRFALPEMRNEAELKDAQGKAAKAYAILNDRLLKHDFVAGPFSAADIALYPQYVVAPEGGLDMTKYDGLPRWATRLEKLPGFEAMRA